MYLVENIFRIVLFSRNNFDNEKDHFCRINRRLMLILRLWQFMANLFWNHNRKFFNDNQLTMLFQITTPDINGL